MTQTVQTPPYVLNPDDKAAHVMVYTASQLILGEVVVKQLIRVSTWLRTNIAPDWVCLYNAKVMFTSSNAGKYSTVFTELHIATSHILAFHLVPPSTDPIDFDQSEPNRRMQPVSILIANFRFDGHLRLAAQTSLGKFLEAAHETFSAIYDARVTNPQLPGLGTMHVPYVLVRQEAGIFAVP